MANSTKQPYLCGGVDDWCTDCERPELVRQIAELERQLSDLRAALEGKWISADKPPKMTDDGPEFVIVRWKPEWRGKRLERSLSEEDQRDDSIASSCGMDVCFIPYLLDEAKGKWSHWQPLPLSPKTEERP